MSLNNAEISDKGFLTSSSFDSGIKESLRFASFSLLITSGLGMLGCMNLGTVTYVSFLRADSVFFSVVNGS